MDYSSKIEELLLNNEALQHHIDSAIDYVCKEVLNISVDDYIHHISIAQDGTDLSAEGRHKKIQQDIHNYLAKGKEITKPDELTQLVKDNKEIDAQLDAFQRGELP